MDTGLLLDEHGFQEVVDPGNDNGPIDQQKNAELYLPYHKDIDGHRHPDAGGTDDRDEAE